MSSTGAASTRRCDNHADWQSLADQAAARLQGRHRRPDHPHRSFARRRCGHGDGRLSGREGRAGGARGAVRRHAIVRGPGNVARVLNLTQRDYAYMRRGPGFHGSLVNVDVSSDPNIDHLNIDKSPRLHARVISEVLAVVGGTPHDGAAAARAATPTPVSAPAPSGTPGGATAAPAGDGAAKPDGGRRSSAAPRRPRPRQHRPSPAMAR